MTSKPSMRDGYDRARSALVRTTCLYIATKLGDLLDEIVVVGGLVPYLLVDLDDPSGGLDSHAGTMDLDMGLALAILTEERYRELGARLAGCGIQGRRERPGQREVTDVDRARALSRQGGLLDFLPPTTRSEEARFSTSKRAWLRSSRRALSWRSRTAAGGSWLGECPPAPGPPGAFRCAARAPSPSSRHLPSGTEPRTRMRTTCSTCGEESAVDDVAASLTTLGPSVYVDDALSVIERDFRNHDGLGPCSDGAVPRRSRRRRAGGCRRLRRRATPLFGATMTLARG